MRSPRLELVAAVALAAMLSAAAACSGSDDDASATEPPADAAADGDTDADTEAASEPPATAGDTPTTDQPDDSTTTEAPALATTTTIDTVPDTGVPGIDSTDDFCRSWSEFAGSFQALALSAAFSPGAESARSEVAASGAIIAAVDGLDEHLPAELEEERDALVTELAGPMTRRAARAGEVLVAAGFTDDEIAAVAAAWLDTLAVVGIDDPEIRVVLPDGIDAVAFAEATEEFVAQLPPIDQDPSLITAAEIPMTEAYLSANCPDQGTLGGNDVIDQV